MTRLRSQVLLALALVAGCSSPSATRSEARSGAGREGAGEGAHRSGAGREGRDEMVRASILARPLTLADCLRLALENIPTAEALKARLDLAASAVTTADTWPNPTLAFLGQDYGVEQKSGEDVEVYQAGVSYPVFFRWTRGLEADVARLREGQARASVEEERRLIRLEVGRLFHELRAGRALVAIEGEAAGIAAALAASAERRVAAGDMAPREAVRARAEALEARRVEELARRRDELDRLAFSVLLGAERPVRVELAEDEAGVPASPALEAAVPATLTADVGGALTARLVARALEERPDVKRAEAGLRAAEVARDLEERRAFPLDQLVITGGARDGANGLGALAAASMPVPVFDRNQGGRERAQADLRAALAERERAHRRAAAEVETALLSWLRAREVLETYAAPIARARDEVLASVRRQFDSGDAAYLDLVTAQRDAVAARRTLIDVRRAAAVEGWRLSCTVGLE